VKENMKNSKKVVPITEPSLHKEYSLWMGKFCNLPYLVAKLRELDMNVAGTLRLSRTHVPV